MNMAYQNTWLLDNQQQSEPVQASLNNFDFYPAQSNFFLDPNQHQTNQLQYQAQFNFHLQGYSQQTSQAGFFSDFPRQVQLTTSTSRKGRSAASESIKRQRQLRRNERERERQARLNSAFDVLRNSIPSFLAPYKEEQKLTQIETLRLAKYYIGSLKDMLDKCEDEYEEDAEDDCEVIEGKKARTDSSSSTDGSLC